MYRKSFCYLFCRKMSHRTCWVGRTCLQYLQDTVSDISLYNGQPFFSRALWVLSLCDIGLWFYYKFFISEFIKNYVYGFVIVLYKMDFHSVFLQVCYGFFKKFPVSHAKFPWSCKSFFSFLKLSGGFWACRSFTELKAFSGLLLQRYSFIHFVFKSFISSKSESLVHSPVFVSSRSRILSIVSR